MSFRAIARELKCSQGTVKIWIDKYQESGDVQDEEGRGRKRKTSEAEDMNIISMTKKLRIRSLAEISQIINKQGIDISSVTVRRRLNEQGLYKLQSLAKPLLSDDYRDNRLEWAKANKNTDWSKVIFTDEIIFSQFNKPRKVWRQKGEIIKAPIVKYSGKIHVYRCFSEKGFGKIYCFTENLNADLLYTIYETTLLPSARIFFGKNNHS